MTGFVSDAGQRWLTSFWTATSGGRERKIFDLSLLASFLIHVVVMASLFIANLHYQRTHIRDLEVIYHPDKPIREEAKKNVQPVQSLKSEKKRPLPDIITKQTAAESPVLKEFGHTPHKAAISTEKPFPAAPLEGKRLVAVPVLSSEKISNPRYLNYHDRIRNKIKDRAYFYIDDPNFQNGEVYLTFVLLSDGTLKAVQIINEKTTANDYLRSIGLRSIRESSPFPPFPADLKYPELSFNIVISFKVGK